MTQRSQSKTETRKSLSIRRHLMHSNPEQRLSVAGSIPLLQRLDAIALFALRRESDSPFVRAFLFSPPRPLRLLCGLCGPAFPPVTTK